MWMVASAIVLMFSHPASADPGATVTATFEFYALGQGDVTGFCLNTPPPPVPGALQSCVVWMPGPDHTHVEIAVFDSLGDPVYFSVQQRGGTFGWGCGTITSHPGGLLPLNSSGPGGGPAELGRVFPWAGPGLGNFPNTLNPNDICPGSLDANLVEPGTVGTVTFTFHNHVAA